MKSLPSLVKLWLNYIRDANEHANDHILKLKFAYSSMHKYNEYTMYIYTQYGTSYIQHYTYYLYRLD